MYSSDESSVYEKILKEQLSHEEASGEPEVLRLFVKEDIPFNSKKYLSSVLINLLMKYFENNQYESIVRLINKYKLIDYYYIFTGKLDFIVSEGLIDLEKLRELSFRMIFNGKTQEEVKLGITLGIYCKIEDPSEIFEAFSPYGSFTFYLINFAKKYPKINTFIFNLTKELSGYGKLIALSFLEFLTDEIKIWGVEKGWQTGKYEEIAVRFLLDNVDIGWYIDNVNIDKDKIRNLSMLLSRFLNLYSPSEYEYFHNIFEKYLPALDYFGSSFEDLKTMVQLNEHLNKEEKISNKILSKHLQAFSDILFSKRWLTILKDSVARSYGDSEYIIKAASLFDIDFTFDDLSGYLENNKASVEIYLYLMSGKDKESKKKLIEFALKNLKEENLFLLEDKSLSLIEKTKDDLIENSDSEDFNLEAYCFEVIIEELGELSYEMMALNLKALRAKLPTTRKLAIKNIRSHKDSLSSEEKQIIKSAWTQERDFIIKSSIKSLLEDSNVKKREFIDIKDSIVSPYVKDIYISSIDAAGVAYRDTTVIEETLKAGDIVFLKREKDNPYDKNAILIACSDGYVIGYVPKKSNFILKNLLDGGKYLYGIIKEVNLDTDYIRLRVYLSYEDVIEETKSILFMLKTDGNGFIQ